MRLEIDQQGVEARVTITPGSSGVELSPTAVKDLLAQHGVKEGISQEEIEKAFRTAFRKAEPVVFVAARGTPPAPSEPEGFEPAPISLPRNLKASAEKVLSGAKPPEIFRVREVKVKSDKTQKKSLFSRKQDAETVWEKKIVREPVQVDPAVADKGYVKKGSVVARLKTGSLGRDGRSVFGRPILVPRTGRGGICLGANLALSGAEVKAAASGFLRKGADWIDVVPFQANEISLTAEGATCLLSFVPGAPDAPPPDLTGLFAEAAGMGFGKDSLIPEAEIARIIRDAAASRKAVEKRSISPTADSGISVIVSPDRMRATLTLRKGRGSGKPLSLAEVGDEIRRSGIKNYRPELVKKDILTFYRGPKLELADYTLAVGQEPEKGADGRIEFLVDFLKKEKADEIIRLSQDNARGLEGLSSLAEFPIAAVESVGVVKEGAEILEIHSPGPGTPGLDVMNNPIPAERGDEPRIKSFENVKRRKDFLVSTIEGIVEIATIGNVLLIRARAHRDGELRITVSDDRMKGFLSFIPAVGTGRIADYEEVRATVEKEGIVQGLQSDTLLKALDAVSKNMLLRDLCIAVGKPPRGSELNRPVIHVHLATGKHVAVREDGKADFKNQDTITQVAKGTLLATIPFPGKGIEDGWDVTGKAIPAITKETGGLQAGKNVRVAEQPDGGMKYYADADGEFVNADGVVEIKELHTVPGDVDLSTGNVKFKGKVHVKGAVISGFSVVCGDDAVIDEVVQAALISSDGSIWVGHGVKGEGKAILRARGGIMASFAEQAVLISMGDIQLNAGCIRCQVKCNGRLVLESDKGVLMGGTVKAKLGVSVHNLGSAGGARTEVFFGQDYIVLDQIEREVKEIDVVKHRIAELDAKMKRLEHLGTSQRVALVEARLAKVEELRDLENRNMNLISLRDKAEEHFVSEVVVRGTLFPGVIVESHGRLYHVTEEKTHIALYFDAKQGRILERGVR